MTVAPPNPNGYPITVADLTDWLQTFSGSAGLARLTDQGLVGLTTLQQEGTQVLAIVNYVLTLVPGRVVARAGVPRFQRIVVEGDRSLNAPSGTDLSRIVQRVVAEAIAKNPPTASIFTTVGANGWSSSYAMTGSGYSAAGNGSSSLFALPATGSNGTQSWMIAAGLSGSISAEQAILQQQIIPAVTGALATLTGVLPLAQTIDILQFGALRSAIQTDLSELLAESERPDGPRQPRVALFQSNLTDANGNPAGHLDALIRVAEQDPIVPDGVGDFDSLAEESRRASLALLQQQVAAISRLWGDYFATLAPPGQQGTFTNRLILVQRLLESISGSTRDWIELMDGFDFPLDERRNAFLDANPPSRALTLSLEIEDITDQIGTLQDYLFQLTQQ